MVIAQYRHPNYDLYKRSIMGEIERREDEPAVYRALEEGISGRGLIGIIDEGRIVVRHTVSPVLNNEGKIIGALTYEYPNASNNTESICIINKEGNPDHFNRQLGKASAYLQDAILLYDTDGICTFANLKARCYIRIRVLNYLLWGAAAGNCILQTGAGQILWKTGV